MKDTVKVALLTFDFENMKIRYALEKGMRQIPKKHDGRAIFPPSYSQLV